MNHEASESERPDKIPKRYTLRSPKSTLERFEDDDE